MASATDIITYIGIPLAVLGVLPILYTFALSILTQRRIRHLLIQHGHKPYANKSTREEGFVIRASAMTSLIEVEMPRYTIAPVERVDERYWEVSAEAGGGLVGGEVRTLLGRGLERGDGHVEGHMVERAESTLSMLEEGRVRGFLRGGSWRTFHWRRLVVGRKLYRIQYEDELREPPAEIEFADLVNFLLDWGAQLDEMGWEKLRSGGLWTPAGTVLLKVSDDDVEEMEGKISSITSSNSACSRGDWVLRTSMPDDSDGVLTLCCRWPPGREFGAVRNATSLPPGWGRLRHPSKFEQDGPPNNHQSLLSAITTLAETNNHLTEITSFRFKAESGQITKLYPELSNIETGTTLDLFRMSTHPLGLSWFTSALSSHLILTKTNGTVWGLTTPTDLITFLRKDSIPCGVLVLLNILPSDQAPDWHTPDPSDDADRNMALAHQKRFQARLQAERLEAAMPPDQAKVHRANREAEERRAQTEQMMAHLAGKRAREQKKVMDAIASPRMGIAAVAKACLGWLIEAKVVAKGWSVVDVAGAVLWLLILQSQVREGEEGGTMPVLKVLEEWSAWTVAGGMKKEQFEMLDRLKAEFCYAVCLVAVVEAAVGVETGKGKSGVDMLECLRLWRKVRLG